MATTSAPAAPDKTSLPRSEQARTSQILRLLTITFAVAILSLVLSAAVWRMEGGSWFTVRSPSMGMAAPVGTLVLTRPVAVDELAVGDVITFTPSTAPNETVTHRVVSIDRSTADESHLNGATVSTRGDINGAPDPWTVHQGDLIGRVEARWWAVGWAVQALPILVIGGAAGWGLTRFVPNPGWRSATRIVGSAALFAYTAQLLKPFLGVTRVATDAATAQITLVSTGILPLRVTTSQVNGPELDLRSGQTGVLPIAAGSDGRIELYTGLHMTPMWWIVVTVFWLIPLLYVLVVGIPRTGKGPSKLEPTL